MNHTHKRRSKTPPLSVLFNTIIAQNTIIAIIYFKLYAVEFFRTPKFIHFLGEHHRVLKKD